ncbi:Triosephosphate isomerase [hydrothermal vent metagenome]|uniref:triose-phosphate isomerase n=1 Tax=hydrothermal vent metagenome TaxID=652676 RepID=A0A3B0SY27_9ZZZZ
MARKMLIAGNWKMNGLQQDSAEFQLMLDGTSASQFQQHDVLICPPATLLAGFAKQVANFGMLLGGEDCHPAKSGAHTGDISAQMLKDAGASYCIVGHSERRADYKETDVLVKSKAEAAIAAGLIAIVCVGETLQQRKAGKAIATVTSQVQNSLPKGANANNCVIAYEPVWAIGTGETATLDDIAQMHGAIRDLLAEIGGQTLEQARILYGGSVKPGNANDIFSLQDIDGGLIGGASLKAADFNAIIAAAIA